MKCVYVTLLALCVPASAAHAAEEATAPVAVPVEVYKPPTAIDLQKPGYPVGQRASGAEGWVIVNMMIDPHGRPTRRLSSSPPAILCWRRLRWKP